MHNLEELEAEKGLDLGDYVDRFAGIISSYLDGFTPAEERHRKYQKVIEALKQTQLSERAQTALVYVD